MMVRFAKRSFPGTCAQRLAMDVKKTTTRRRRSCFIVIGSLISFQNDKSTSNGVESTQRACAAREKMKAIRWPGYFRSAERTLVCIDCLGHPQSATETNIESIRLHSRDICNWRHTEQPCCRPFTSVKKFMYEKRRALRRTLREYV